MVMLLLSKDFISSQQLMSYKMLALILFRKTEESWPMVYTAISLTTAPLRLLNKHANSSKIIYGSSYVSPSIGINVCVFDRFGTAVSQKSRL